MSQKEKADRDKYINDDLDHQQETRGRRDRRGGQQPLKHFQHLRQMESQNLLYDQIYDLVAFRIIVDVGNVTGVEVIIPSETGSRPVQGLSRFPNEHV
jgi:hypothetical protein